MPLSKARDRERKKRQKFQPNSNLNDRPQFQPNRGAERERLQRLIDSIESKPVQPEDTIPIYNPAIHRVGDTVQVRQGNRLTTIKIPEIDGDGHSIPDY